MSRSCLSMQRASSTRKEMVIHGVQRTLWLGTRVRSGCLPACFSTPKKRVQREAEQQKSMEMKVSQDWWCQEVLRAGFHGKGWLCNATQWLPTATLGCFSGEESMSPCKAGCQTFHAMCGNRVTTHRREEAKRRKPPPPFTRFIVMDS